MRRRSNDTGLSVDGNKKGGPVFPPFVVEEWLGRIEPGRPLDGKHAFLAYNRARLRWCREHAIDSYGHLHGHR